mmetsp:Transcript_31457/g.57130  ORF Transcript_31457/g.57130 Transcript_31457/m.57130 type:complete len:1104 (-) Transcript_31457:28-3339(-)
MQRQSRVETEGVAQAARSPGLGKSMSSTFGDRIGLAANPANGSATSRSGSLPSGLGRNNASNSNVSAHGRVQEESRGRATVTTALGMRDRSVSEASSLGGYSDATSASGLSRGRSEGRSEGWLSKKSSGTMARWQRRYWTLEGYRLNYHSQCGGPVKRSFDLRRVRRVSVPEGYSRELELDFGFRAWRLRADSQASARRWLQLFENARQITGGSPINDTADFSDDESAGSTCSTVDSASAQSELLSAMQRQGRKAEGHEGHVVQVARAESPAVSADTFRSGWARPPHVDPPLGNSPASVRSSSAPGARSSTADNVGKSSNQDRTEKVSGSTMNRSGSLPTGMGAAPAASIAAATSVAAEAAQRRSPLLTCELGANKASGSSGPHHEGWLSKLSGGNVARWQRRYFRLDGCRLQYCAQPGGTSRRSFDLRRMQHVCISHESPTELELDYGFRIWRLRAESEDSARRWFLLLDAARLVAGDTLADSSAGTYCEDGSDDESAASVSSQASRSSAVSMTEHSTTMENSPRFGGDGDPGSCSPSSRHISPANSARGTFGTLGCSTPGSSSNRKSNSRSRTPKGPAPATLAREISSEVPELRPIADRLEVDPDDLDQRFEAWLQHGKQPSLRHGLAEALDGMWVDLGAPQKAARGRLGDAVDAALASLHSFRPDPTAFGEAVEGVLAEYLARMRRHLEHWVREYDPVADEVADVVTWLLFEARPSLEKFQAGAEELSSKPILSWRETADTLEQFLLSEWENRSCDEICESCKTAYTVHAVTAPEIKDVHTGDNLGCARISVLLEILRGAVQKCDMWPGHATARDRAASVLIAALNAVLRHFRSHARSLLAAAALASTEGSAKHRMSKMIRRLGQQSATCVEGQGMPSAASRPAIIATGTEAAELAKFCSQAIVEPSPLATHAMCSEVLVAFAGAFDREGVALCTVLAEVHFVEAHRQTLKDIAASLRASQSTLSGPCSAAKGFLEEVLEGDSPACGSLACAAIIQVIVKHWVRAFQRWPPRLSTCPTLPDNIAKDERLLEQLADRWGAQAKWRGSAAADPIQTLREVRALLHEQSTAEALSLGAARLEVLLGQEQGTALATAVRVAIAR